MPLPNCLKGCIENRNGQAGGKGIFKLYDDPILYPFVEVIIPSGISLFAIDIPKAILSSGNKSSRLFEAQVKSFQFGISNGLGVKIEIVDEAGGAFYNFFKRLGIGNEDIIAKDKTIRFRFGYTKQNIDGIVSRGSIHDKSLPNPNVVIYTSQTHALVITDIECQASSANCFKFTINGTDNISFLKSTIDNRTLGGDSKRVPLTIAIKEALEPYGYGVDYIESNNLGGRLPLRFQKIAGSCTVGSGSFIGGAVNSVFESKQEQFGPCGIWPIGNRSPIIAIREWIQQVKTSDNKSIGFFWEDPGTAPAAPISPAGFVGRNKANGSPNMSLVFFKSNIHPTIPIAVDKIIGTYVVNGGNCSPVVSFQPNFKYDIQACITNSARPAGTAESAKGISTKDGVFHPDVKNTIMTNLINSGLNNVQQSLQPNGWIWWVQDAAKNISSSMAINNYGNFLPKAFPIEAELKIQGNPAYDMPSFMIGYFLNIVYINPYRPKQGRLSPSDIEWERPPQVGNELFSEICNPIISNLAWQIVGVSHDIRDGTYHTTIKVKLPAPGIDIPPDYPLGGKINTLGFVF